LPPALPTRSWVARYRRLLIPAAGLVVVGAAAAAALVLVLTPRTSVEKMVPASVDVYAVANLDPSVSQKMNLLRAVHRFPDTSTDQKLAQQLDTALKDSGITFTGDIQPWLGAQVALAARIPQGNAEVPVALFVVSRDDAKAMAALTKLRAGSQGQKYRWHDTAYGGITITVAQPTTPLAASLAGIKGLGDAEAFQGAALALSARQDGIVADATVRLNAGKLSASTRDALAHAGHADSVIGWIPSSSDGFFAFASLNRTIQSALDQAGPDPSVRQATDSVGLTGPQGILQHLTGDFA